MSSSAMVPPLSDAVTSVPRKTSRTAGSASTVAGSPSPTKEPPARQISRLTTGVSARTTCSIQITATPSALTPRTISTSWATSGSVRPPATSSSSSSLGPDARARASSSRLRWSRPSRGPVRLAGHPGPLQRLRRGDVAGALPKAGPLLRGDEDVLEHGHIGERPRHLVGAPDAEPAPRRRVQLGDLAPGEGDLPGARGQIAGDEAEQAGLAGSVRPHDPDGVPGPDLEREVLGYDDTAEAFRHAIQLEQRVCHPVRCWSARGFR